jgi:hypothetical protein
MLMSEDEVSRRQDALQAESREVLERLGLLDLLAVVGRPIVVGSAALGLMTWRDIDVEVYCPELTSDRVFEAVRPLVSVPGVFRMNFRDWTGARATPQVPDGYYWGIRYESEPGIEWKLDLWFVAEGTTRRMGSSQMEGLAARLTPAARRTILRLKSLWFEHPRYRHIIYSTDIYDAVLEHGVETPEQFEGYLRERGKLD